MVRRALVWSVDKMENQRGKELRVMDCAGRAQRRQRLRADNEWGKFNALRACESGVALRFPPQSKTISAQPRPACQQSSFSLGHCATGAPLSASIFSRSGLRGWPAASAF